jgi:pilus retraction protein PilT
MSVLPSPGNGSISIGAESLDSLLVAAADLGASDIHLSADAAALMRLDGELIPLPGHQEALPGKWLEAALLQIMGSDKRAEFAAEGEVDLSYAMPGGRRVRVNVFRQHDGIAAAMRLLPDHIPSLDDLGVPAVAAQLALRPRGLVLVVGPTGSGKSTTLAAMVDLVNGQRCGHIVSVEDPIEYRHESRKCLVHQREIGADTHSFAAALRHILREDPDVVMIGELRDPESIGIALTAAETGQLVLGTLHTQGAAKTIDRIIDSFPPSQQNQIRSQLSGTLQGVISQVLLPRADRRGRVAATEVLVHTDGVGNLIRESQLPQLQTVMQTSSQLGMHTLDQDLQELVRRGVVTKQVAAQYASDLDALAAVQVDQILEHPDAPFSVARRKG